MSHEQFELAEGLRPVDDRELTEVEGGSFWDFVKDVATVAAFGGLLAPTKAY